MPVRSSSIASSSGATSAAGQAQLVRAPPVVAAENSRQGGIAWRLAVVYAACGHDDRSDADSRERGGAARSRSALRRARLARGRRLRSRHAPCGQALRRADLHREHRRHGPDLVQVPSRGRRGRDRPRSGPVRLGDPRRQAVGGGERGGRSAHHGQPARGRRARPAVLRRRAAAHRGRLQPGHAVRDRPGAARVQLGGRRGARRDGGGGRRRARAAALGPADGRAGAGAAPAGRADGHCAAVEPAAARAAEPRGRRAGLALSAGRRLRSRR